MAGNFQKGPQGVRSDRHSGSKVTNLTKFDPFSSSIERIYRKYYRNFKNKNQPIIKVEPTHGDFEFPFSADELEALLKLVPPQFLEGVKALLVTSGSRKEAKAARSLYRYGTYWRDCIFLCPIPKTLLQATFVRPPPPSILQEYRRAGIVLEESSQGLKICFDTPSLRTFYFRDVLMHEVGHHNDNQLGRSYKKVEGFANWFATEYGYRLSEFRESSVAREKITE